MEKCPVTSGVLICLIGSFLILVGETAITFGRTLLLLLPAAALTYWRDDVIPKTYGFLAMIAVGAIIQAIPTHYYPEGYGAHWPAALIIIGLAGFMFFRRLPGTKQ